jgi:hypothetical protein
MSGAKRKRGRPPDAVVQRARDGWDLFIETVTSGSPRGTSEEGKRGKGRPADPWRRQQKLLLLALTALDLPPVRSLAELEAVLEARLNEPEKWKIEIRHHGGGGAATRRFRENDEQVRVPARKEETHEAELMG